MDLEEWGILALIVLVAIGVIAALTVPTTNFLAYHPPSVGRVAQTPSLPATPHLPPTRTPTPRRPTPTATPEPTPTPCLERWCNESGCYCGVVPTPTPSPSPSPTPVPAWVLAGFKCELPDNLVGEPWAQEYKWDCACMVRGKWDLGSRFVVWEACYSSVATAWRRESCECVEIICGEKPSLC